MDTPSAKRPRGRPEGRTYPHTKSLKLREVDKRRLERLAEKLDRDESAVIRYAVEQLAKREGVE
jgi:predicted transcriptional regulator